MYAMSLKPIMGELQMRSSSFAYFPSEDRKIKSETPSHYNATSYLEIDFLSAAGSHTLYL
jgi:hypothetical protein